MLSGRHVSRQWASKQAGTTSSPQPLLLLLPQLHVPLDHLQDVLGLVVRQAGQVQLPAHGPLPRRATGPRWEH